MVEKRKIGGYILRYRFYSMVMGGEMKKFFDYVIGSGNKDLADYVR